MVQRSKIATAIKVWRGTLSCKICMANKGLRMNQNNAALYAALMLQHKVQHNSPQGAA
jgi:hypothetical protein